MPTTDPTNQPMSVDDAIAYVQFLKDIRDKVFVQGIDYGNADQQGRKPSLLKPGAEKAAKFFSFATTFDQVQAITDLEQGYVSFGYKCTLTDPSGRVVMQAEGYCNSQELKYKYTWTTAPKPDRDTEARMKADGVGRNRKIKQGNSEVWVWQERGSNPDALGHANSMSKIAQKRAFVAAVLYATGLSEFFTQDTEDMPPPPDEHRQAPPPPARQQAQAQAPPPPSAPADEPMRFSGAEVAAIERIEKRARLSTHEKILENLDVIVTEGKNANLSEAAMTELKARVNAIYKEKLNRARQAKAATA